MSLSPQQQQVARFLIGLALSRGAPGNRAREFAAAADAEAGLRPGAVNKTSGAAGLFQLLSPGYRQKAQALGGLFNPRANAQAILPDYLAYWKSHPGAAPGAAARDVERSGEGAGFYSAPLAALGGLSGAASVPSGPGAATNLRKAPTASPGSSLGSSADALRALLLSTPTGQPLDAWQLFGKLGASSTKIPAPAAAAPSPSYGHGGTVTADQHGSTIKFLTRVITPFGLTITSTTSGRHAPHSYHYAGRAVDSAGSPRKMAALAAFALEHPHNFKEMFYTGPDAPGSFVKNGKVYPNAQLDPEVFAEHRNHVHLAR